nr:MAG TPA: hypothetical protein [Caudoviricetes sp.]
MLFPADGQGISGGADRHMSMRLWVRLCVHG